jgi:hypothetical protein
LKSIIQVLNYIAKDLENRLPELLNKHKLEQLTGYSIGVPVDPDVPVINVRVIEGSSAENDTLLFNIIMQLPGILEKDAYYYLDALNEYLDKLFDVSEIGYEAHGYTFEARDNVRTAAVALFWEVTLTHYKDDCDY